MIFVWAFAAIAVVTVGLYYDVPLIRELKPSENLALVNIDQYGSATVLSRGSETLWYQWQTWIFIALACMLTAVICGVLIHITNQLSDEILIEKRKKLEQLTEELESSKRTFEDEKRRELQEHFRNEEKRLTELRNSALESKHHAERLQNDAEIINKQTNLSNKKQSKKNRSQLAQRDRLSEQKRLIAKFLEQSGWELDDGTPITYNAILELARKQKG